MSISPFSNGRVFIADWHCEHPFVESVLVNSDQRLKMNDNELCSTTFRMIQHIFIPKLSDFTK